MKEILNKEGIISLISGMGFRYYDNTYSSDLNFESIDEMFDLIIKWPSKKRNLYLFVYENNEEEFVYKHTIKKTENWEKEVIIEIEKFMREINDDLYFKIEYLKKQRSSIGKILNNVKTIKDL